MSSSFSSLRMWSCSLSSMPTEGCIGYQNDEVDDGHSHYIQIGEEYISGWLQHLLDLRGGQADIRTFIQCIRDHTSAQELLKVLFFKSEKYKSSMPKLVKIIFSSWHYL
eukprot:TRINITY_DN30771_c0_g1_i1.p1 TRINITY_DN30771_c0_g1~~TRINITY_DN30771_c0_g1_i1.p1  ORF type:complete len:109 (-),score=2.10 TRINITY_DN30771_c0_g1_i1:11-337(-)